MSSPFTETLAQSLELIEAELKRLRAEVVDADWLNAFSFGGLAYGQTKEAHVELTSFRGKPTRKYAHATIYRTENGRYEWLVYFL